MKETKIITAALPYVNNIPHLGNLLGSHLPADVYARYCRLNGDNVIFVGGTDENGAATEFTAYKEGITPKELCDKYYKIHKDLYAKFNISYDNFSRTSKDIHHKLVQEFFLNLYTNGFITSKTIKQPFCENCKRGLADRFIKGTCPHCGYEEANGDQCEQCGSVLNPIDLINPYCAMCGSKNIIFKDSSHLFLNLKSVVKDIENWIDTNPNLRSQVKSLAKGWIKQGIEERCITRDLNWGVRVPLSEYNEKVFYVWFDNVIGYISSTADLLGEEKAIELWKDKSVKNYYFVGKDNIPFHTIFWPGQIIGEGRFHLPENVCGYQYLNFEGQKFSKSKSVGIFLDEVVASNIPIDYWRFYLTYILTETKDADFVINDFIDRINKELIDNFGNYVNRVLNFIYVKLNGKVPEIKQKDVDLEKQISEYVERINGFYSKIELRYALYDALKLSDLGNKYLNEKEPWKTGDYSSLAYGYEIIRLVTLFLSPIIPSSCEKIFDFLNTDNKKLAFDLRSIKDKKINKPEILFTKLEEKDFDFFLKSKK